MSRMMWELETGDGVYFWGGILSNWAKSPFEARLTSYAAPIKFNSSEQYMMMTKAELFGDHVTGQKIMETLDPRIQKSLGRAIRSYSDEMWNPVARDRSYVGVYQKFMQNESMKTALLGTGEKIIVEASPFDIKWGVGLEHLDPAIFDKTKWRGTNWLGHMLMRARDDIRNGITDEFAQIDWRKYE